MDIIQVDVLYEYFKLWFKNSVPDKSCPKKTDFRDYLKKHHYKMTMTEICCVALKSVQQTSSFN